MNNLCMPLLHKFPLKYSGKCLVGYWIISHHPGDVKINPFTGIIKVKQACYGAAMIKGFLLDEVAERNGWVYTNIGIHYSENGKEFSLKPYDYKGIDVVRENMPGAKNSRYWKVAISSSLYYNDSMWWDRNGPEGEGGLPLHLCEPIWRRLTYDISYNRIIANEKYFDEEKYYLGIEDGYFIFGLTGADGAPVTRTYIILNFDVMKYQEEHVNDLYIVYYTIYNLNPVNNIGYTPLKKEVPYA